ncbi:hypothetical protein PWR05_02240 [Paraburkholderia sp. A2RI-6]
MAELFGEEGIALCDTIESRMRKHLSRAEKAAARVQEGLPGLPSTTRHSPFSPATSAVPQPFSYRSVYRHTA